MASLRISRQRILQRTAAGRSMGHGFARRCTMAKTFLTALATTFLASCGGGGGDVTSLASSADPVEASMKNPVLSAKPSKSTSMLVAGDVSIVNTTTAGDQSARAVEATTDGGYTVAWFSSEPALRLQSYDSAGAKRGAETNIAIDVDARTPLAAAQALEQACMALLSDGSAVVLYRVSRDIDQGGGVTQSRTGLYFQHFASNGALLGSETLVDSLPDLGGKSPFLAQASVMPLADSGFVIGWTVSSFSVLFGSQSTLSLRWFDSNGQAVGAPVQVGSFPALAFDIVPDLRGGFALTIVRTDNFFRRESEVEAYDANHAFTEVVAPTLSTVLLLPLDSGFVLFANDGTNATEQLLDTQGNAQGAAEPIKAIPSAARELQDGNYVTFTPAGNGMFTVQLFAADMTPLDQAIQVNTRGVVPLLASLPDPGLASAWTSLTATDLDVFTQRFTETLSAAKKACLNSAKQQHLTGRARQAFMDACIG
jgi:hypothetical protein